MTQATIQPITKDSAEAQSANLVQGNLAQLKALFPEAFTEGRVDFDVLKQLLGAAVDEREEKYGLNWHGKRRARQLALTPSTGTLRPCPDESVDWDTTQNLFIEGDNLEVLKLLQKSYSGNVKVIYIDPPYNTGKDFVYPDNFQDSIKNYLELTGQVDGGQKMSSNTEASGRFHTDWLNMMYPRLKLARNLLRDDGCIFISIHYRELGNLQRICDDIFGEENFVGIVTWKARVKPVNIGEAKYRPQGETEYVLIYQKADVEGKFLPLYTGGLRAYPYELNGRKYRLQTILKSNRGGNYRTTMSFEINGYTPPDGQRWQAGEEEVRRLFSEDYVEFKDGTPFRRYFEDEEGAEHDPFYCFMEADWSSTSEAGKNDLNELMGNDHGFDTVKPVRLIQTLLQSLTSPSEQAIILDFFAGSGTTGEAVFKLNAEDQGDRRFILVQLPEPLSDEDAMQRSAAAYCQKIQRAKKISEITKERLRRAAKRSLEKNPGVEVDYGFRVFSLAESNIRAWNPSPENLQATLDDYVEHLLPSRTERDVLYELLLKLGLDLAEPIESRQIAGKTVYSVGAGALLACLSDGITREVAEPLALRIAEWQKTLAPASGSKLVFKDSAFADDVAKTNLAAILSQHGLDDVRSL